MMYLVYLFVAQFLVAYLGYKSASITIRKHKPTTGTAMVFLGFAAIIGSIAVLVIM